MLVSLKKKVTKVITASIVPVIRRNWTIYWNLKNPAVAFLYPTSLESSQRICNKKKHPLSLTATVKE